MSRFSELPEPVRLEDTVASHEPYEAEPPAVQSDDEWMLKNAGG